MNIHKNARVTSLRRGEMAEAVMEGSLCKAHAARVYGVSAKIVTRWVERFKAEGRAGMADRSSLPVRSPNATDRTTCGPVSNLVREAIRWNRKDHRYGNRQ